MNRAKRNGFIMVCAVLAVILWIVFAVCGLQNVNIVSASLSVLVGAGIVLVSTAMMRHFDEEDRRLERFERKMMNELERLMKEHWNGN